MSMTVTCKQQRNQRSPFNHLHALLFVAKTAHFKIMQWKDTPRKAGALSQEVKLACRQWCSYLTLMCAGKCALVLSL